jgi:hypothetical protein
VKNLLAGEQQAAVTVAVEALMDAKPEAESFATFDPKVTINSITTAVPHHDDAHYTSSHVHAAWELVPHGAGSFPAL